MPAINVPSSANASTDQAITPAAMPADLRGSTPGPPDPADLCRAVNGAAEAAEDLCIRARLAADIADRSQRAAAVAAAGARLASQEHRIIQDERPRRHSPRPRQVALALATVALDGVACYFAAQALGSGQDATLVWTGLFLAILAAAEIGLDHYADRPGRTGRLLAGLLVAFVFALGVLRFYYLIAVGVGGLVPAATGAALLSAATGGFLFVGYRALRMAETPAAWRARRAARRAALAARAAQAAAKQKEAERDRLGDAYLCQVRRVMLKTCPAGQQPALEAAVRAYLFGAGPA